MNARIPVFSVILAVTLCAGCRKSTQLSGGMAPTITNAERVTINYAAYAISRPSRWDVVVLRPPQLTNLMVLKRVIALPTETISLTSSGIVVNGSMLRLPASLSNIVYCAPEALPTGPGAAPISFPYTVPRNQYFVVGDNWTNSLDSRYYGAIPSTSILGRVMNK
jgi:signal peptidase I